MYVHGWRTYVKHESGGFFILLPKLKCIRAFQIWTVSDSVCRYVQLWDCHKAERLIPRILHSEIIVRTSSIYFRRIRLKGFHGRHLIYSYYNIDSNLEKNAIPSISCTRKRLLDTFLLKINQFFITVTWHSWVFFLNKYISNWAQLRHGLMQWVCALVEPSSRSIFMKPVRIRQRLIVTQ